MLGGNMKVECQRSTTGGKGNRGMFIERDKRVCAAGVPTAQADLTVQTAFDQYLLQDHADALLSDAIHPPPPKPPLAPLRNPIKADQRNAIIGSDLANVVNPPSKSKFQILVDDLKDTPYKSYWKKRLGEVPDPIPMFPEGYDIQNTTYGRKLPDEGRLYDIIMPKVPLPDKTPATKKPGVQINRNYCKPPYNPNLNYGHQTGQRTLGQNMKCLLTDPNITAGRAGRAIVNYIQADFLAEKQPRLGQVLAPNNNINCVPEGYAFGKLKRPDDLPGCLTSCELNPGKLFFNKCLAQLNTVRKCMSTRFLPTFFRTFYLNLKYYDQEKTGWLPKEVVYKYCHSKLIRFDARLMEPLLCMWDAIDGERKYINYKTFVHVLNFTQPLPNLPHVPDVHPDCLNFRTTYREMVKPGQEVDNRLRAGLPSGRYLDLDYPITPEGYCKAHRTCLPQESDMNSCLKPSVLTLVHVSHRNMFAKREPWEVKRVFEAAGESFTDESFNELWEAAKKYHSQGWVCYETFRKALQEPPKEKETKK